RSTITQVVPVSGGTTEPTTTPVIFPSSRPLCLNNPSTSRPSSSDVRSRSVWSRQLWISVFRSNTPITMLVLPTSIAKSIDEKLHHGGHRGHGAYETLRSLRALRLNSGPMYFAGDQPFGAFADTHQQRAHIVDTDRHAGPRAGRRFPRHTHAAAAR